MTSNTLKYMLSKAVIKIEIQLKFGLKNGQSWCLLREAELSELNTLCSQPSACLSSRGDEEPELPLAPAEHGAGPWGAIKSP